MSAGPEQRAACEEVLDAHQHLWDPARREHPWMARTGLEPLRRRFDLDDLRAAAATTQVRRTVVVQATSDEEESRELLAVAAVSAGLVAGVVGWLDLLAEDVESRLARLRAARGGEALAGVRHQVEDEDVAWLEAPAAVRGVAAVTRAGLAYDLLVRPDQLRSATSLADRLPDARLVLDHAAKPPVGRPGWSRWAADLRALGRRPGVVAKLSGLLTLVPAGAGADALAPTVEVLLEAFGPDRVLVGTDWPVSTLAAGYAEVVATTTAWTAALAADERCAVLHGTACRVYGLPPAPGPPDP